MIGLDALLQGRFPWIGDILATLEQYPLCAQRQKYKARRVDQNRTTETQQQDSDKDGVKSSTSLCAVVYKSIDCCMSFAISQWPMINFLDISLSLVSGVNPQ